MEGVMNQEKNIPLKNYIILAVVLILTIIIVIYFYRWQFSYEKIKLSTPIIEEYMQVINYNELNDYLIENKNAVIYSSKLGDKKIRDFEVRFKNLIIENSLKDKILYLNITSEINNENISKEMKNTYKLGNKNITNIPSIMIYEEGKLISIYNIKDDNYNIDKIERYLEEQGVIND